MGSMPRKGREKQVVPLSSPQDCEDVVLNREETFALNLVCKLMGLRLSADMQA